MSVTVEQDEQSIPLVRDPTRSQNESVETVLNRMKEERVFIPDYQRDSGQWSLEKKSLFIESILNNLTVPAFFFSESGVGKSEVVDGQQRLTTLQEFSQDKFRLCKAEDVNYLVPASIEYAGKTHSELAKDLRSIFYDYPLTIIYLPRSMNLSAKLEVFRRINEGGTPLTGQDIRLAYYSQSKAVNFIRLAGIYDSDSESAKRMIARVASMGLKNPWDRDPDAKECWKDWWEEKDRTKGQTPSHMFLWFLTAICRDELDSILKNTSYLKIAFRGTIEEALDVFCAHLQYQEQETKTPQILPYCHQIDDVLFGNFCYWIKIVLNEKIPNLSIEKYRQLSLVIAALTELELTRDDLNDDHWIQISRFIQNPREAGRHLLGTEGYPEPKGRWTGKKGQKTQCDKAVEAIKKIVS
ncbi:DUF262 domain-containing protein [Teichococcus cervicalis]|uniref:GmrSD restriction endonucleases N-terminal domain-containing protein n=1 Tax=Pseudoroseomonas cervicalis ATCC 49957 TaxID=525371 RepID=D5RHR7_9PROT|nr:DUF262 domain-containing protein [Pseudoroseomonas cervicalis]EFH13160.1 hypothetical protein HMPREF0731_0627 [Pseudoroseomonas cervicalis ATCC 49957]